MARSYAVAGNCVNTQSSTLPLCNIVGAATIRPKLYDMIWSSDTTPADSTVKVAVQRSTTVGTWGGAGGAAITPQQLDPGDPGPLATANQGVCSVGPTLTAGAFLLQFAYNQRATFRWVAAPSKELIIPATANNGLSFLPTVQTGAGTFNSVFILEYEE